MPRARECQVIILGTLTQDKSIKLTAVKEGPTPSHMKWQALLAPIPIERW